MHPLKERLQEMRSSFTPAQFRIADYILANTLHAALLTATEMAQQVNADPATVVRFAQKLGYDGYLELKAELGRLVREHETGSFAPTGKLGRSLEDAHRSLKTSFNSLWGDFDKRQMIPLIELLGMPSRLLLLSDPSCEHAAAWLAAELRDRGFTVDHPGEDPAELAESMLASDAYDQALIIEGPVSSPSLEHLAVELRRKGLRSFAILGSHASQISFYSDAAIHLPPLRDRGIYPFILQRLIGTVLYCSIQVAEAFQDPNQPSPSNGPDSLRLENGA